MSENAVSEATTVAVPGVAPSADSQTPPEPPAQEAAPDPLAGMSDADMDALADRIEQRRQNRPQSIADQIAALRADIEGTSEGVQQAAGRRQEAKAQTAELASKLDELTTKLRRFELAEAATAAGFRAPAAVAEYLATQQGDPVELVTKAAASGAWAMSTPPAPSASVGDGSNQSKGTGQKDAGRAALEREIAEATGRR